MRSQKHGGLMILLLMKAFRLSLDSDWVHYGLHQLTSDPTHILPNSSSWIDLIFTDQPNLVTDSEVYSSLHLNCHHQITYCKFNLFIEYPPPYERQVSDYKHADTSSIKRSLNQVNWNQLFQNKNVNEQVAILNNIILNIFSNFVPNKILTFDDRDPPHGWLIIQNQKFIGKISFTTNTWTAQGIKQIMTFFNKQYQRYQN